MRLLFLLPLLFGCHAKFKREAPTLGAVRTEVITVGAPYVHLGQVSGGSISVGNGGVDVAIAAVGTLINVGQAIGSIDQTARIANAVNVTQVNETFEASLSQNLGSGPPFAWTSDPTASLLQLEITSWGMEVPYLGAPGAFTYDITAHIYKPNGDRVYTGYLQCTAGVGTPEAGEIVLSVVNNVRQLNEMTDAQINDTFQAIAEWCGQDFVRQLRRHAG